MLMGGNNGKSNGKAAIERPSDRDLEIYHRHKIGGIRQRVLADEHRVTQGRIAQIIGEVEPWVLAQFVTDVEYHKRKQSKILEGLAQEAIEAWERSQHDAVTTKESKPRIQAEVDTELESGELGESEPPNVETTTKGQTGDPRMIEQARGCFADIRKIWGVDAPAKTENTNINIDFETREQLKDRLVKLRQGLIPTEN
jgi:hypothetical protein